MSNILRKIKRNKARALGLPLKFFLDSYQARMKARYMKSLKKMEKLIAETNKAAEEMEAAARIETESGGEV